MTAHRLQTLALAVTLAMSVTGCGKDQTVQRRLGDDTAAVVRAMNAKDVAAARRALDALDADIGAADRLDQLSTAQVSTLRAGVRTLRADLALLAPTVTPTLTPTPVRTTSRVGGKRKHGKGDNGD